MNPQLNLLKKHNLLTPLIKLLQQNLTNNFESSHELKVKIQNTGVMLQLDRILTSYPSSGFKEPASFIGAVCSYLSKQGIIRHSMKVCPIKRTVDDAFKL